MLRAISFIVYSLLLKHLPRSVSPFGGGMSRVLRGLAGHYILKKCGRNVNIEHGATFGKSVELGDNSGIGVNCVVPNCKIGKNVMMGPEVVFIGQNHRFDRTDIPMIEQGSKPTSPIEVGDDVWIGYRAMIMPGVKIL